MVTMVTRCTGTPSQLPVVKMSWGRKSKKKLSVLINLYFLLKFIRQTGPMVTMVTTISASSGQNELGEKSKKKPNVLTNFYLLV